MCLIKQWEMVLHYYYRDDTTSVVRFTMSNPHMVLPFHPATVTVNTERGMWVI